LYFFPFPIENIPQSLFQGNGDFEAVASKKCRMDIWGMFAGNLCFK
jgi:hypothetical protein